MKKVILGASALMIGAVAFAQQTMPMPLLNGPQETVTNKSTNLDANAAETYQLGNDNKVRVAQAGTLQTAYVSQDNGSAAGGNLAMIQQTGQVGPNSGVANVAEIKQSGETNAVGIGQQGDSNAASAYQGQGSVLTSADDASIDNVALIQQGTGEQAQYNAAETYQDGAENFIGITQTYDRNSAIAIQGGDENAAAIVQDAGPNLSDGHLAATLQLGNRNSASIAQSGTAQSGGDTGRNVAAAVQVGDDNISKQVQNSIANEGVQGEQGLVNQGDSTTAIGASLDNNGQGGDVFAQLEATDSNGDLSAAADGSFGGVAVQMQTGKMNAGEIHQFGSSSADPNRAQQNQSGWNQEALIVQNSNGNANGGGNWAFQDQSNDNNVAAIGQNGFDHMAQQVQNGKRNQAFSTQRGNDNKLSSVQTGNDSRLETLQNGRDNTIVIAQSDGQSAWVEQNRGEYGSNGGNQAAIIQTGPNGSLPGDLGSEIINCDFQEMMQTPAIEASTITINDLCPDCN